MSQVVVSRSDLSVDDVAATLEAGLGARYTVRPGVAVELASFQEPAPGHPDEIVVSRGASRLFRAQVSVSREAGETVLEVRAGGVTLLPWLVNRAWVEAAVLRVLRADLGGR